MPDEEPMGEVVDEGGSAPPGFTLEAEASRRDPVSPGIVERTVEPEPDDDELPEIIGRGPVSASAASEAYAEESGDADNDDDDVLEDPDDPSPVEDI